MVKKKMRTKKKEIGFYYKRKKIKLEVEVCGSVLKKFIGFMFSRREKASALLFEFGEKRFAGIHSMFVFFPFIAIWLDERGKLVEINFVKPFKLYIFPKKTAKKLIEIPFNSRYKKFVKLSSMTERFK